MKIVELSWAGVWVWISQLNYSIISLRDDGGAGLEGDVVADLREPGALHLRESTEVGI